MDIDGFKQRLTHAVRDLDLCLNNDQIEKLITYLQQMQRWNKTYNLTALRDPELMLIQHVFDSLSVIAPIKKIAQSKDTTDLKIIDVGSGGGLPGVVLAIACSTWNVHCVDAVEKKMAFVRQMSGVLQLPNLQAHHLRIEQAKGFDADIVISRAFASLVDFVNLSERHIKPNGQILAMKAKYPSEEITALENETSWKVERIQELIVPELKAERCLVYLIKG